MNLQQPRIIEVPGIPGKLREQTLDEYIGALPDPHLARTQLNEIRAMALEGMKATHELLKAMEKIRDLEAKLNAAPVPTPLTAPPTIFTNPLGGLTTGGLAGNPLPAPPQPEGGAAQVLQPGMAGYTYPKVQCPHCTARVSTAPGPWASHMKTKHSLTGVPIPTELPPGESGAAKTE